MLHQEGNIPHTPKKGDNMSAATVASIIGAAAAAQNASGLFSPGTNTTSTGWGNSQGGSVGGGSSTNYGYSHGGTYGTGATASALSHAMMQEANAYNAEQARLNREWQERMASTAYQRAMKDLRKAGLNPILAYTNGPASTGSGATASSAMGQAYTDNYTESNSYGHSSEFNKSWNESHNGEDYNSSTNLVNNLSAVTGKGMDVLNSLINFAGNAEASDLMQEAVNKIKHADFWKERNKNKK